MLTAAGFRDIRIDTSFAPIHRTQAKALGFGKSLLRRSEHRYAIVAMKPA
jgi:hypothetical protein